MTLAMKTRALEVDAEVKRRVLLAHALRGDEERQRALLVHYASHPLDWLDDWAWTYDPRMRAPLPKRQPFVLWPRQRELVLWTLERIERGENGLLKKARDMGASWVFCALAAWMWLFMPEVSITFGSRKEALVDRLGDSKALLPKIRQTFDALPKWMMPEGFSRHAHDNHLQILNPANGALITGEGGDEMGRGGRSTVFFADEFAFVPRAERVDAAINDNAGTVIYLSTSNGAGTLFHRKEQGGDVPVFYFLWRDHPYKDDAWAAQKVRDTDEVTFAREHEGDDARALEGVIIPASWVMAAVDLELPVGGEHVAGFDPSDSGADESILARRQGPVLAPLRAIEAELATQAARIALTECDAHGVADVAYDRVGVGAAVAGVVADGGFRVKARGVQPGGRPSVIRYDDNPERTAIERFANWGTEAWWCLRRRFERTYEVVTGIADHPVDELISIPNDPALITQLSSRLYEVTETGKIIAESKKKMRKRGVPSPDRADAAAYCFTPSGQVHGLSIPVRAGRSRRR